MSTDGRCVIDGSASDRRPLLIRYPNPFIFTASRIRSKMMADLVVANGDVFVRRMGGSAGVTQSSQPRTPYKAFSQVIAASR
ncbi:unnamed protein product [Caenorhabditis auriculariae]|uniref:Uncharacterized protein n=1 Tax=Caenorhabditis auriculariae TaxID=2777116 RepID=A0A8S1GX86_9PELO|nr:unnamed protein product [Caenorhabditis auriculariae]